MQFKGILSFFDMKSSIVKFLLKPNVTDSFSNSLDNDDIDSIEEMLIKNYQISYEQKQVVKEKLQELAGYFYPRNFYKNGIRLNKTSENIVLDNINLTNLNLTLYKKEYSEIANIKIHFDLNHLRYFQLISKYDIIDDFILEQLQTKSGIGQFFNIIAGINMYYCDEILLQSFKKYSNDLKNYSHENNDSLTFNKVISEISELIYYTYVKNNEINKQIYPYKNSTVKLTDVNEKVLEQYPISNLETMSFLSFLTPAIYNKFEFENTESMDLNTNIKFSINDSPEYIFTFKNDYCNNNHLQYLKNKDDKLISTLDKIYTDLNIFSSNIYIRICKKMSKDECENILNNILENNNLFSYCLFSNIINNHANFNISYNIKKGEDILKTIDIIKKRKPHIMIKDTLIQSIENQVYFSNLIIKYLNPNINLNIEHNSSFFKEKELIEKSNLDNEIKVLLLEILKMRENIISNNEINELQSKVLQEVSKKILQILQFKDLVSNNDEIIEHTHELYENFFKFEYSFLKKKPFTKENDFLL